jgi:ankyrin repeat protein
VAAQQGSTETVRKLLEYQANPNLVDKHGTSALFEAVKNSHEETMEELIKAGAKLCFDEGDAASTLCQTVFNGDLQLLQRLLKAKIPVDAGDYDRRRASMIAAAEGSLAALKLLVEYGADLSVKDRWGNTAIHEAKASKSAPLLEYLESLGRK